MSSRPERMHRIAVLDDYQDVAASAPTGRRSPGRRGRRVPRPLADEDALAARLEPTTSSSPCVSARRSRAPCSSGCRPPAAGHDGRARTPPSIWAAREPASRVRHRRASPPARSELTWALILAAARHLPRRTPTSAPAAGSRPSAPTGRRHPRRRRPRPARAAGSPASGRPSAWTSSPGARTSPTSAPPRTASAGSTKDELLRDVGRRHHPPAAHRPQPGPRRRATSSR